MKKIFFLCAIALSLFAKESLDEQIEAIKNAPPQKRVEMMNRLKLQIATMNEEERAGAIESMHQNLSQKRGADKSGGMRAQGAQKGMTPNHTEHRQTNSERGKNTR